MADNSENKVEFIDPRNPLDPIVVFDPEYVKSNIILPYTENDENEVGNNGDTVNPLKVNGVTIPIIKLNNKIILPEKILSMTISITKFLPEIILQINDEGRNIQATDVPGMNNIITVIMTAPVNGANKKISLDFYITNCTFNNDDSITYNGEFDCKGLKQVKYTQVGSEKLNTYELLENIAKELQLGFAATDKCKDINDKKWRQIYSKTYKDYILLQLKYAGLDEDSIFDAWIDEFGYLVLVNVPYIINEEIDSKQLSIKVISGNNNTLPNNAVPEQEVEEVYRIITNSKEVPSSQNLMFTDYRSIVDNDTILNKGNLNRYYYLSSPCDENIISQEQIQVFENSVDGIEGLEDYKYENIEFIGTNQTDDEGCEILQQQIITNYFNKLNAKTLEVKLDDANYSLQRGMVLDVILEEYEATNKQAILNNMNNAVATTGDITEENSEKNIPEETFDERSKVMDLQNGVINPALSGLYYIKGINFIYQAHNQRIEQVLFLTKKGLQNNLTNKYTSAKYFSEESE